MLLLASLSFLFHHVFLQHGETPWQAFQAQAAFTSVFWRPTGWWEHGKHCIKVSGHTDKMLCNYLCTVSTSLFLIFSASIANNHGSKGLADLVIASKNLLVLLALWDLF